MVNIFNFLPITHAQCPIMANAQLPITNYQLPIPTSSQLPQVNYLGWK
ncbi:MAG: hypothetical protein WBF90_37265 [Rivularia sp. (in: cyanobacteria)]